MIKQQVTDIDIIIVGSRPHNACCKELWNKTLNIFRLDLRLDALIIAVLESN